MFFYYLARVYSCYMVIYFIENILWFPFVIVVGRGLQEGHKTTNGGRLIPRQKAWYQGIQKIASKITRLCLRVSPSESLSWPSCWVLVRGLCIFHMSTTWSVRSSFLGSQWLEICRWVWGTTFLFILDRLAFSASTALILEQLWSISCLYLHDILSPLFIISTLCQEQ